MQVIVNIVLILGLLAISLIDIREKHIDPRWLAIVLLGGLIMLFIDHDISIISRISAVTLAYMVLAMVSKHTKGSIGMGDVKLCAVISMYLGLDKALGMLTVAFVLCAAAGLVLVLLKKVSRQYALPFSPFVAIAFVIMFYYE